MMVAECVDAVTYGRLFAKGRTPGEHLYNSVAFSELNSALDGIEAHYLVMADSKPRAGIVLARTADGALVSARSAPFGGMVFTKVPQAATVDACVRALQQWGRRRSSQIRITLPPDFMQPALNALTGSALLTHGTLCYANLSYHYDLRQLDTFEQALDRSARQKLHEAQRQPWQVSVLDASSAADAARAYRVIALNREAHGYPLAMSLERVCATAAVASSVMMVMSLDGADVAAVVAQRVTPQVAQVVYWGDAPGYSQLRPMNIFPLHVLRHLRSLGYDYADIGPAASAGATDFGLATYKESIGCIPSLKRTFTL